MLPDRVSNPGPLTYESGALPIALRGPAQESSYTDANRKGIYKTALICVLIGSTCCNVLALVSFSRYNALIKVGFKT